jgi:hypothetical protein
VVVALARVVAEVLVPLDHLLRGPAADPELQPPAGDQVSGAGVLGHVERVLVAHVDDAGAELDATRPRARRRKERERRGELLSEVVHAEVGAVRADLLGRDREVDGLQQYVGGRPRLRVRRGVPVAEGQEADLLHVSTTGDPGTFFP